MGMESLPMYAMFYNDCFLYCRFGPFKGFLVFFFGNIRLKFEMK